MYICIYVFILYVYVNSLSAKSTCLRLSGSKETLFRRIRLLFLLATDSAEFLQLISRCDGNVSNAERSMREMLQYL